MLRESSCRAHWEAGDDAVSDAVSLRLKRQEKGSVLEHGGRRQGETCLRVPLVVDG